MGINHRIKVSSLTKKEFALIEEAANFTEEQAAIYHSLNSGTVYDVAIMMKLNMSAKRYYATKKETVNKIERIAKEFGFIDAIKR
jgi:hypothetical protein